MDIVEMRRMLRRRQRAAMAPVEYTLVAVVLIATSLAAISLLGQSVSAIGQLGTQLASNVATSSELLAVHATSRDPFQESYPDQSLESAYQQAVRVCRSSIGILLACLVLGLLYARRVRVLNRKQAGDTCSLDQSQFQSAAIDATLSKRKQLRNFFRRKGDVTELGNLKVKDFMTDEVATVLPNLTIEQADKLLRNAGYRRVIVAHDDGRLAGVLSRTDIVSRSATNRSATNSQHGLNRINKRLKSKLLVSDVMTRHPKTATPEMEIRVALSILMQNRISCLPVVDGEKLVGMISTTDMLAALQCLLASQSPS
jgi:CBS domain-containing protein